MGWVFLESMEEKRKSLGVLRFLIFVYFIRIVGEYVEIRIGKYNPVKSVVSVKCWAILSVELYIRLFPWCIARVEGVYYFKRLTRSTRSSGTLFNVVCFVFIVVHRWQTVFHRAYLISASSCHCFAAKLFFKQRTTRFTLYKVCVSIVLSITRRKRNEIIFLTAILIFSWYSNLREKNNCSMLS